MTNTRVASFFSGIGGFELGLVAPRVVPLRRQRIHALGNAVVPRVVTQAATLLDLAHHLAAG